MTFWAMGLLGAAFLAACGGPAAKHPSAPTTSTTTSTSPTTTSTTVPGAVAPLTGLPVSPSIAQRPAVIVKIDNDRAAPPQSGLDQADVVYEEVVEGGITRYLSIFQSQDASPVGPVRSVRGTDSDIVRPIGGLFAYSGGTPQYVSLIDSSGVKDVGANDDGGRTTDQVCETRPTTCILRPPSYASARLRAPARRRPSSTTWAQAQRSPSQGRRPSLR